jgi:hypothetical protein
MIALMAVSPACGGGGGGPTPVGTPSPPPTPSAGGSTTFTAVYDRVIAVNCLGCHGEVPSPEAGVLLMATRQQAYAQLVNVPASGIACAGGGRIRVIPGNPDGSLMFNKVSRAQPACGLPMPAPTGGLPGPDVQLIRDWILAGAAND